MAENSRQFALATMRNSGVAMALQKIRSSASRKVIDELIEAGDEMASIWTPENRRRWENAKRAAMKLQ